MKYLLWIICFICWSSCKNDQQTPPPTNTVKGTAIPVPVFRSDTAFHYIEKQISFGPRVPGTDPHTKCAQWILSHAQQLGLKAEIQEFKGMIPNGKKVTGKNILVAIQPENPIRILFFTHWDSRYTADQDPEPANHKKAVPAADDGASGTAVLLEMINQLHDKPLNIGIDFFFTDMEDQGEDNGTNPESWCQGAQYWSQQMKSAVNKPKWGILLDMVGASGARFGKEGVSMYYAPGLMNRVWTLAQEMGFGAYFTDDITGEITDDHYFVNKIANIPSIDIINRPPGTQSGFVPHWHTIKDDVPVIDKRVLHAVGQVCLAIAIDESNSIITQ